MGRCLTLYWHVGFGTEGGGFDIERDILKKVNRSVEEMKLKAGSTHTRDELSLAVEFWYETEDRKITIRNPTKRYYYDIKRKLLVVDV